MDVGSRFVIRIQIYLSIFLFIVGNGVILVLAAAAGYLNADALGWPEWISLLSTISIFSYQCVIVMLPYAYVNEQSRY
jgi:hypothetical protein